MWAKTVILSMLRGTREIPVVEQLARLLIEPMQSRAREISADLDEIKTGAGEISDELRRCGCKDDKLIVQ